MNVFNKSEFGIKDPNKLEGTAYKYTDQDIVIKLTIKKSNSSSNNHFTSKVRTNTITMQVYKFSFGYAMENISTS